MAYHEWGEDWCWEDLDAAITYVSTYCKRWGRFSGQAKEKYGTARISVYFHYNIHDLIWVGHYWCRYKQVSWWKHPMLFRLFSAPLEWLDLQVYAHPVFNPVRRAVRWYQTKVYARAYKNAVKLWPHITEEICEDADYPELLKDVYTYERFE